MFHKIKQRKKIPKVPRLDWDFSKCDKIELRDCHFYEFSREREFVRNLVAKWREEQKVTCFDDWKPVFSNLSRVNRPKWHPYDLYNYCPEWPTQPYLSIPTEERRRRRELIVRPVPLSDVSTALTPVNVPMILRNRIETGIEPTLDELERGIAIKSYDKFREIAAFEIDWRHSDGIITKRFVAWLKIFRSKRVKQRVIQGRRNDSVQMRMELKALGAWRLTHQHGLEYGRASEETAIGESGEEIPPLYNGQSNWNRACEIAKTRINNTTTSRFLL
jgi:hypothetical protein